MRAVIRPWGLLASVPAAALLLFVLSAPATWSGAGYAVSLLLLSVAATPRGPRAPRRVAALGCGLLAATLCARCFGGDHGRDLRMRTGSRDGGRFVDREVDEQD